MLGFSRPVKLTLFASSYVPLLLIMAVELNSLSPKVITEARLPLVERSFSLSLTSLLLLVLSILLVAALLSIVRFHSGHRIDHLRCDRFRQRNELLSSYLLVYVFVFVGLEFSTIGDWLILAIFLGMLAVLQMNSEMLHVNPILGVIGYGVYEVQTTNRTVLVLSKHDIRESLVRPESDDSVGEPEYRNVQVVQLGDSTYMTAPDHE